MWRAPYSGLVTEFLILRGEIRQILVSLSRGASTSTITSSQLDDLAREIERLHSQLHSSLELIRTDIRDSKDFVSADLDALRLSVRGALSQLDAIKTQLLSRPSTSSELAFIQPIAFRPLTSFSQTSLSIEDEADHISQILILSSMSILTDFIILY